MLIFFSLLLSGLAQASEFHLYCKGVYNSEIILDREVTLQSGQRNLKIGGAPPFEFILSSNGENKIELQAYHNWEPSRSYATSTMSGPESFVELSIWKQDYLMEVRCTLKKVQ